MGRIPLNTVWCSLFFAFLYVHEDLISFDNVADRIRETSLQLEFLWERFC